MLRNLGDNWQTINKYLPKNSRKSQQSWWTTCRPGHSKIERQVAKTCGRFLPSTACVMALIVVVGRRSAWKERVINNYVNRLNQDDCSGCGKNTASPERYLVFRSRRPTARKKPTDGTDSVLTLTTRVCEGDGDDWLWRKKIIGLAITVRAKNGLRPLGGPANRRRRNDTTLRHRGAARPRCDHGRNQKRSDKRLPPPPPPSICGIVV